MILKGSLQSLLHLNQAGDIEALHALTVPNAQEVTNDPSLKFKGKTVMVLPPFLTKMLMDADSKDPFKLFQAACKALNNFDESHLAIVPRDVDLQAEEDAAAPDTAKEVFLYVIQLLYLASKH